MKTIGLIGGTSWHSTIEYYRHINKMVAKRLDPPPVNPPLLIFSLNIELMRRGDWDEINHKYLETALTLQKAGAEAIVICANTPHKVYPFVSPKLDIPIIHIADAVGEEAQRLGMNTLGLLGTKPVMEGNYIGDRLTDKFGMKVLVPDMRNRVKVHRMIVDELVNGIFTEETKKCFLDEINTMQSKGIEGVILGCTELPILMKSVEIDLPFLDTTKLHAKKAVDFILG